MSGCADAPPDWNERLERVDTAEDAIINGTPDTQHDAVVALFSGNSGCTGTIIHHEVGGASYVLTAAHCFDGAPIQQVAIGDNYQAAEQVLNVVDWAQHPSWNTNSQNLEYDFAMIRAVGGNSSTPVIPVLTPEEDALAPGTPLVHVGYGLLSVPNGSTSQRHFATGNVDQVASIQLSYNQPNQGPCSGDSGGPNLVDFGQGERVAGIISFGDETCASFGVSGRASSVYQFIVDFIGAPPTSGSASSTGPTTSAAATTATSGAGGGGATSGAGGATSTASGNSGEYFAGEGREHDYEGDILTTGACASAQVPTSGESLPWAAGFAMLGLWWTRRRRTAIRRS